MYHSFLIHSSADGHLGCSHVLAIINSAAMNIGVHVPLSVLVSSMCMPECKLVQPLWRTVWRFLKKLEIELPYDPAIPLLGIHTELIFLAALFLKAKYWKQWNILQWVSNWNSVHTYNGILLSSNFYILFTIKKKPHYYFMQKINGPQEYSEIVNLKILHTE